MPDRPLTWNATLVLQAMSQGHRYGFEIMKATGLPSGTVYPALRRLEAEGRVESHWEADDEAHADGRPARRNYVATAEGRDALAEARERFLAQQRLFGGADASGGAEG